MKDQSFPVCTIRQKPEKLIHCIVWAKALFEGLFGAKEQSNNIIEDIINEIHSSVEYDPLSHATIIFKRMFESEVKNLYDNLSARLQSPEVTSEEKQKESEFLQKIRVLDFAHYKDHVNKEL